MWKQFAYYWGDTPQLKFGYSFAEKRPVTQVVGERIWPTVLLVGVGTLFATIVGIITGVFAGWRRNGDLDVVYHQHRHGPLLHAHASGSSLLIIMFFAVELTLVPRGRMEDPGRRSTRAGSRHSSSVLWHLILPWLIFGIAYAGEYHLIMRSSLTGVMKEDFVLTARAKGLSDNAVLWRHVVPNAMLPTVTLVMMNFGFVHVGRHPRRDACSTGRASGCSPTSSMHKRDYPVMQAVFLLGAASR